MAMNGKILTVLSTLLLLILSSCNTTVVEATSEEQKKSDAFIEALKAKGEYTELLFLNEDHPIFYKELKDAPAENKGVHPYQNSTVTVTLSGEHAITGQEFQPVTTISDLVIYSNISSSTSSQLVVGVQIALQNMEVGDTWEIIIPWQLGYGASSAGNGLIPPYSPLKFEITLEKIVSAV